MWPSSLQNLPISNLVCIPQSDYTWCMEVRPVKYEISLSEKMFTIHLIPFCLLDFTPCNYANSSFNSARFFFSFWAVIKKLVKIFGIASKWPEAGVGEKNLHPKNLRSEKYETEKLLGSCENYSVNKCRRWFFFFFKFVGRET